MQIKHVLDVEISAPVHIHQPPSHDGHIDGDKCCCVAVKAEVNRLHTEVITISTAKGKLMKDFMMAKSVNQATIHKLQMAQRNVIHSSIPVYSSVLMTY